jgi:hypothetical protein
MWSRARQCWQACVGAIVVAAVMAVVILTRLVAARRWYSNLPARLQGASAKPRPPQVLIAQFNGHTYQLGQAGRVHRLHIGSGRGNGIRIQDSTVAPRHLQLRKTRRGLMLRNLARTPVLVNQQELKPRRRQPLVLPATVRLSDRITVSLRAKAEGQPDQSGENQP